jgi:hypothetical protein
MPCFLRKVVCIRLGYVICEHGSMADNGSAKMANNRMHSTVLSFKDIGRQFGYHYTFISPLVRKCWQTNGVKYLQRQDDLV